MRAFLSTLLLLLFPHFAFAVEETEGKADLSPRANNQNLLTDDRAHIKSLVDDLLPEPAPKPTPDAKEKSASGTK